MVQNKMLTPWTVGVMLWVLNALLHNHSARESLDSNITGALVQIQQKQRLLDYILQNIIVLLQNAASPVITKQQFQRVSGNRCAFKQF